MVHLWPRSVHCHVEVIHCTCLKIPVCLANSGYRANRLKIWDSGGGGGVTSRAYMVYLWPYSVPVWKNLLDLSQGAATLIWLTQIAIWEFSSKVLAVEYDIFDRLVFKIFVGSFNARVFKFVWPKMCVMLQLPILWSSRASRSLGRVCGEVRNLIWWHMDKVKKGVIVKSAGLQFWLRGMYTKHYWLWHNATPAVDVSYMSS